VEFSDDDLERLQEDIATRLGFVLARHRLELYGICRDCREGVRPTASTDRVAVPSRR
jgi:Fe2+ or Zn2+ uptake regulation protein